MLLLLICHIVVAHNLIAISKVRAEAIQIYIEAFYLNFHNGWCCSAHAHGGLLEPTSAGDREFSISQN